MATFSLSCTSTAANDVAGWMGGGVWSVAMAGSPSPKISSDNPWKALILECLSSWTTVSFDGLDTGKAQSVSPSLWHGYLFLQCGARGGPGGRGALVVVADGHHPKIPRGNGRAAGTRAAGATRAGREPAGDLAACRFGGRGAGRQPPGWRTGPGASRSPGDDFHHHSHRAGAGPGTLRRGAGVLLPAGPAVGGQGLSECPEARTAHPGGNGVLAQSAPGLLSKGNPGDGGECAHLRSLLAALPNAA